MLFAAVHWVAIGPSLHMRRRNNIPGVGGIADPAAGRLRGATTPSPSAAEGRHVAARDDRRRGSSKRARGEKGVVEYMRAKKHQDPEAARRLVDASRPRRWLSTREDAGLPSHEVGDLLRVDDRGAGAPSALSCSRRSVESRP